MIMSVIVWHLVFSIALYNEISTYLVFVLQRKLLYNVRNWIFPLTNEMKQYHKTLLKGPFWLESTVLPHNEMKLDKYTFLKKT